VINVTLYDAAALQKLEIGLKTRKETQAHALSSLASR
jgi:hypothetical protein